jgi:hypothetical protein
MNLRHAAALSPLLLTLPAHALSAGDLQFVSFNADNESLAVVTLVDLAANTNFFLTDNEWDGSAFNTGESYHRWNTGASGIAAGTVVVFTSTSSATTLAASQGTLTREAVAGSTSYGISQTAETIYLYQGATATAPSLFLTAITTGDLSNADGSLTNTGLSIGVNAMQLSYGSDSGDYIGARTGQATMSGYRPLAASAANWLDRGDGNYASLTADLTAFAAPVPEPSFAWLAFAGLVALRLGMKRSADHMPAHPAEAA